MISPIHTEPAAEEHGVVGRVAAELLAAVAMLTRLPVPRDSGERNGAGAFALVGAAVGLAGLLPLLGLGSAISPVPAILAISAIAILSGGIHLDGLADTADALVAVGPDGAERARKDPAVGVGGVSALVMVLGVEVASLAILVRDASPLTAGVACIAAGAVSRAIPVVLARLARSRSTANGMGGWFAIRTTALHAVIAVVTALLVCLASALLLGSPGLMAGGIIGGLGGLAMGFGMVRARGQLDGDLLGATVELSFALTVLGAAAVVGGTGG